MTNFEVRQYDAAGRLGELEVPRAGVTVQTPTILPVVNPHVQTVDPSALESDFGAEILITNSYILHGSDELREPALDQGLHDLLDFSGAIMTDSGSFQLAEYGDIDVTTEEILQFQSDIGSDIGTPVDIPTPPDVDRERAESELETTQDRLERAAAADTGEMLVSAPVQGSTYPDLRERAAEHATTTGLDVFPLGAVVPLMNEYRYADLADVVAACKRGLGEVGPVHLFGAGHPMMFAMAAALGCDLFDSAAYALYARDDRYLTVRGTELLDELEQFPCTCPICTDHTPAELRDMDDETRQDLLARHNLHVTYGEIRTVRQAIRSGNLLELVDSRARGHPAMLDGYRTLLDHAEQLERTDPVSKDAFFYTSAESARRPEVLRHQERLDRFELDADEVLLTEGGSNDRYDETWGVRPPFGPYPRELGDTYPLTAEVPDRTDRAACEAAADGVARLVELHPDVSFTLVHDDWPETALDRVPDSVRVRDLHARE
ncbi:tRNA guanosine(15) transglycosylase TgtA [Haloarcula salinisoli]|uniref:tRNA-guanine(15) transglycosylase n=1 Tax=Haloarcula salinisoli TaxID=2487746 RepID=A0A8J7YGJ8_9EURY|nr:tRNA guanosine(15) transglycosylase TgtA [Halomicroarcula salinisoli]MBX0305087.1 tRNA guanosine(15) transglycosylase TgtA [Halomicroarcula salinisoli]